jgi:biotin carboxyl carrier protein
MASEQTGVPRGPESSAGQTPAGLIEWLSRFEGSPQEFLGGLLAVQCQVGPAESGAMLRASADRGVELLGLFPALPAGGVQPPWLSQAAAAIAEMPAGGSIFVKALLVGDELYGQPARRYLVFLPLRVMPTARDLAAFVVEARDPPALAAVCQRLELTLSLLSVYEMRLLVQRRQADLRRLRGAMETVAAVNEHDRFAGLAMALCNELVTRTGADRASVGFLKGRYIHLRATSHTEKFSRKMKIIQDIEAAMEECADQDVEVVHPAPPDSTFVSRAAAELSKRHGPTSILVLPLRYGGKPVGAILLERPADRPFELEEAESLRLSADLLTPRLVSLEEHDRWIGARAVFRLRRGLALAVGPKHTWIKVAGIALAAFLGFAILGEGTYRVEAPFVFQPIEQQVVPAPFDGFLDEILVEPGEPVVAGRTVLAMLKTDQLFIDLGKAMAQKAEADTQANVAAAQDKPEKTAEAQIARAQAARWAAEIELLEYQIDHARIVSPVSGIVVSGDLKRHRGAPVKMGDVLFEVAPIESLRAELSVPDADVGDVRLEQKGELATASYPDRHIAFVVERVNPMAEVSERENVFKVRVRLDETDPGWMRPGMEGLAKVDIGPERYITIWTRPLVKWVRMKLWM